MRPTPAPNRKNFDENVISTPMYNTEEPESRGPYYVPWKKTSMDFYNKIKESEDDSHYANTRYKSLDGYITGSTIGNVPVKDEELEEEKDNNSTNTEDNK